MPAAFALLLALLGGPARAGAPVAATSGGPGPTVVGGTTTLQAGKTGPLELTIAVPPGFHVYRDMVAVEIVDPGGLALGAPSLPPGVLVDDPAAPGQPREQYEFDAIIEVPLTRAPAVGTHRARFSVRWQACRASTCLYPVTEQVDATVVVAAPAG